MTRLLQTAFTVAMIAALGLAHPVAAQDNDGLVGTTPDCNNSDGIWVPGFDDCAGAFEGNDQNQPNDVAAMIESEFGAGFGYLGSDEDSGFGPFTSSVTSTEGYLYFDQPLNGDFVLILKASDQFSAFAFYDAVGLDEIYYTTAGVSLNDQGRPQDNSHAALWGRSVSVPEPGSAMLMLTGLLGMVGLRRRREADAV